MKHTLKTFDEWLNEAKTFIAPSKENDHITDILEALMRYNKNMYPFTKKDVKEKNFKEIREEIEKHISKKELKRIEAKYNSFDRFLNDLILELNPDLK